MYHSCPDFFQASTQASDTTGPVKPQAVAASLQYLSSSEAYLIDNGEFLFLYLG